MTKVKSAAGHGYAYYLGFFIVYEWAAGALYVKDKLEPKWRQLQSSKLEKFFEMRRNDNTGVDYVFTRRDGSTIRTERVGWTTEIYPCSQKDGFGSKMQAWIALCSAAEQVQELRDDSLLGNIRPMDQIRSKLHIILEDAASIEDETVAVQKSVDTINNADLIAQWTSLRNKINELRGTAPETDRLLQDLVNKSAGLSHVGLRDPGMLESARGLLRNITPEALNDGRKPADEYREMCETGSHDKLRGVYVTDINSKFRLLQTVVQVIKAELLGMQNCLEDLLVGPAIETTSENLRDTAGEFPQRLNNICNVLISLRPSDRPW